MKNLFRFMGLGLFLILASCSPDELLTTEVDYLNQKDDYLLIIGEDEYACSTQAELLSYVENKYPKQLDVYTTYFEKFNKEREIVRANELATKPDDHPDVVDYISKWEQEELQKSSSAGFAYRDFCQNGIHVYCNVPRPFLKKKNRNSLTSYKNFIPSPVTYCANKWWGGTKLVTSYQVNCKHFLDTNKPEMHLNVESTF